MRLPDFQYAEPTSLNDACIFLSEHAGDCKLIAGGTDLLPSMKQRIVTPAYLVNLSAIPDLKHCSYDERTGLQIGAGVTLRSLEKDPLVLKKYPSIAQAAGAVGSAQLREMGTAGGNLNLDTRCFYYNQSDFWRSCRATCIKLGGTVCNAMGGGKKCFAVFSGDLAPMLIALGATVTLVSLRGERSVSLKDYYTGDGVQPFVREPLEILSRINVPPQPEKTHGCYLKYRIRRSIDFPLADVAALVSFTGTGDVVRAARVVLGAVGMKPEVLEDVSELLKDKPLTNALMDEAGELAFKAAHPVPNTAGTFSYRRRIIRVMVRRALREALDAAT